MPAYAPDAWCLDACPSQPGLSTDHRHRVHLLEHAWPCTTCMPHTYALTKPAHTGADPTKMIEDLAKKRKVKTLGVSMGQGQEVIARKLLAQATVEGQWVLLQNTHLGLGFLSEVSPAVGTLLILHDH